MSKVLTELALLEDVHSLPARMQKIYLQLISVIDYSFSKLQLGGATPEQLSAEFIEELVDRQLSQPLSQQALEARVSEELQREILQRSELTTSCKDSYGMSDA